MLSKILCIAFALTLGIIAYAAEAQFAMDGLVSYWSFDEVKGETVEDDFGDHDGTIVEGELPIVGGKSGDALEFDGSGAYVNIADPEGFSFNADFTWAAWIKTDTAGTIIARTPGVGNHAQGARQFFVGNGDFASLSSLAFDVGWVAFFESEAGSIVNEWQYATVTVEFETSGSNDTARLYIDGNPVSVKDNWNVNTFDDAGLAVKIGYLNADTDWWSPAFNGLIDEVAIYDRVLSEAEIKQNFAAVTLAVLSPEKLAGTWGEIKISR